jgi:hypothetical protein
MMEDHPVVKDPKTKKFEMAKIALKRHGWLNPETATIK